MIKMTDEIKNNIFPIYEKLLNENSFKDVCTFCLQWGKNFPLEKKKGLLFVGKSVNGWVTYDTDAKRLFDIHNPDRIFAREDQMEWINNLSGNTDGYNTKKSAFWRLLKKVSKKYYSNEWYSNIAWTNLYKIAPWKGGNPSGKLQAIQHEYCFELLKKEVEILSPEYVILLTSGWEWSFLKYLNDYKELRISSEKVWGKYKTSILEIKGVKFILSQHPQGKKEWKHMNAIVELINEN